MSGYGPTTPSVGSLQAPVDASGPASFGRVPSPSSPLHTYAVFWTSPASRTPSPLVSIPTSIRWPPAAQFPPACSAVTATRDAGPAGPASPGGPTGPTGPAGPASPGGPASGSAIGVHCRATQAQSV